MTQNQWRELTRTQKNNAYRRDKCKRICVNFFPKDLDLADWITSQDEGQAAYIRRLVREDYERRCPEKHPSKNIEQSFDETSRTETNKRSEEAGGHRQR